MKFLFPIRKLKQLARHSVTYADHQVELYTGIPLKGPSLMLVKDEGIYLMSPFINDSAPSEARLYGKRHLSAVYAKGHGKNTRLPGSDFAVTFPIATKVLAAAAKNGSDTLELEIDVKIIDLYFQDFTAKSPKSLEGYVADSFGFRFIKN